LSALHLSGTEWVIPGNPIRLVCNVSGGESDDPPLDVFWYKDGRLLETGRRAGRVITKTAERSRLVSVLVIRRSTVSDTGEYFCRSSANQLDRIVVSVLTGESRHRFTTAGKKLGFSKTKNIFLKIFLGFRFFWVLGFNLQMPDTKLLLTSTMN